MTKIIKKIFVFALSAFFFSISAHADNSRYIDHRGHNLDSLEIAAARWTADKIEKASDEELLRLVYTWHDLMLGYLYINPELSMFYGRKVFNTSVRKGWKAMTWASAKVIGQLFWAKEQYDSAAFYYNRAMQTIETMEVGAVSIDRPEGISQFDIDNGLSAMYGTIGNLYSIQDSTDLAMEYYAKAGEIFEKNGWKNALSNLHYNMAETWLDDGEVQRARSEYNTALSYAVQAGDSLLVANSTAGLGRLELSQGHLRKAIRHLDEANRYYSAHNDEEWSALLENIDYANQILRLQKRQAKIGMVVSIIAILLLIVSALIAGHMRKLRKQKAQTEAVLEEAIEELTPATHQSDIKLNDRELQILKLVADGLSVKEIADKVCLSPETVKWYRKKLLAKFDAKSFIVLIGRARQMGLLTTTHKDDDQRQCH